MAFMAAQYSALEPRAPLTVVNISFTNKPTRMMSPKALKVAGIVEYKKMRISRIPKCREWRKAALPG